MLEVATYLVCSEEVKLFFSLENRKHFLSSNMNTIPNITALENEKNSVEINFATN
jgi:hypothetical protein